MRKNFRLLGVALVAVFAFGVLTAASASATVTFLLAEWLWNSGPVTAELLVDVEGELLLEDKALGTDILCSGVLDGWVNANGADLITEILTLSGVEVDVPLVANLALSCTNQAGCENPLLWADNLPWKTLLELMEDPAGTNFFVILIFSEGANVGPGWDIECMGIIPTSELCEFPEGAVVQATNEVTNVNAEFTEAFTELAGFKLANCSIGGAEKDVVEGLVIILDTEGGNLQVSSEP
jgi:hypothetical protein